MSSTVLQFNYVLQISAILSLGIFNTVGIL